MSIAPCDNKERKMVNFKLRQSPKLTFLCGRQVATEIFFQSPDGKFWSPTSVRKIFFPVKHTEKHKVFKDVSSLKT